MPPDDTRLVERARAGDRNAFDELVRLHADRLYAVLLRFTGNPEDAEEAMQEAFVRAWRRLEAFEGRSQFFTWLYRIGMNETKRRAERRPPPGRTVSTEVQAIDEVRDERPGPEDAAEQRELRRALEQAIQALEPKYRMALVLRDIEGLSTAEAAEAMELKEAAFKSRLHRARLAVREAVDEYLAEAERAGEPELPQPGSQGRR